MIALIVLFGARAAAAGDEMIADRPGLGESASVVGRWHVQIETGLTWARVDRDTCAFDLPEALVRVGLGGSLEFRWLAPDWLRSEGPGGAESGWTDTAVGFKWHVAAGDNDLSLRGTLSSTCRWAWASRMPRPTSSWASASAGGSEPSALAPRTR